MIGKILDLDALLVQQIHKHKRKQNLKDKLVLASLQIPAVSSVVSVAANLVTGCALTS